MKYPLQTVQSIRKRREELAQTRLTTAQEQAKKCHAQLARYQKELDDYHAWCRNETNRLLGAIMNKPVTHREVTQAHEQIVWNRSLEASYVEKTEKAKKESQEADQEVNKLVKELHILRKETLKLNHHRDSWLAAQKQEEENREENDSDEITLMRFQSTSS